MKDYLVIYEQTEDGGWGAYLPDLPGVVAVGRSRTEVESRIAEALAAYAEELRAADRPLPDPVHESGTVHA